MIFIVLFYFGAIISRDDIRRHRIRNIDLLQFLLIGSLLWHQDIARLYSMGACVFVVGLAFALVFKIGMGDIKLISILIPLAGLEERIDIFRLLTFLVVTSIVPCIIIYVRKRNISTQIPWAPSLFSAVILYLATR